MRGVDLSFSRVSPEWCQHRVSEGVRVLVQALWTGGYAGKPGIVAVAEANLRAARQAGMITAGYLNTNPWWPAATSLAEARFAAGLEWEHLAWVFNDVEIGGLTEAHIKAHCEAITGTGKRCAIYTAKWVWDRLGNPKWPWLLEYPLWAAQYDRQPDAPTRLFGPWLDVIGKQYQGTTDLEGVQVDLNVFEIEEDDMADPIFRTPSGRQGQMAAAGFHAHGVPWIVDKLVAGGAKVVPITEEEFDFLVKHVNVRDITGGGVVLDDIDDAQLADIAGKLQEVSVLLQNPPLAAIAKAVADEQARRLQA